MAQLWPNASIAVAKIIKDNVEPMFKDMLPGAALTRRHALSTLTDSSTLLSIGPLKTLHFQKLDLGHVPFKFSNVKVTKTERGGIALDLNVDWEGEYLVHFTNE